MTDNSKIFDTSGDENIPLNIFAEELEVGRDRVKDLESLTANRSYDPKALFDAAASEELDPHEYSKKPPKEKGTQLNKRKRVEGSLDTIKDVQDPILRRKAEIEAVTLMVACDISQTTIARLLGMTLDNLRYNYGREVQFGKDMMLARVANAHFQKALDGNVPAQQFILKAKGGWKEQTQLELTGKDGAPLVSGVEREQRMMGIMMKNPALMAKLEERRLLKAAEAEVVDVAPEEPTTSPDEPEVDIFG